MFKIELRLKILHKTFRFNIITRVVLIVVSIFACFFIFHESDFLLLPLLFLIFTVIQTVALIRYAERTNRNLVDFLDSIRFSDFSRSFTSEGLGSSFDELKEAFNRVIKDFQTIRSEKEQHHFYLQKIIEHVDIALIAYKANGDIVIFNGAAKALFKLRQATSISKISDLPPEFITLSTQITAGKSQMFKLRNGENLLHLLVFASEFSLNENKIKLISLKNISGELEEQELASWQKLIRVLTHEIMNSIAPIVSLTSTVSTMTGELAEELHEILPKKYDTEPIEDIQQAVQTIHRRSEGLLHFVETYQNLTKIPQPQVEYYSVKKQFLNIAKFMEKDLKKAGASIEISVIPEKLKLNADEQLVEQILINLIKNSIQAFENQYGNKIRLIAFVDNYGRESVTVQDNGPGILPEVMEKIFIPFYTTKNEGSGIGLSLSRQIMRQHGGTIKLKSVPNEKTSFTLVF